MSENDSKLCRICLSSNTKAGVFDNPSLNKFFSHLLGIEEPPCMAWLCSWCISTLRRILKLVQLAEESHSYLSKIKLNKNEHKTGNFALTVYHNEHTDIPPSPIIDKMKIKHKSKDIKTIKHKEIKDLPEVKVKDEQIYIENEFEVVKVEAMDMDVGKDDDEENEKDDIDDYDENDDKETNVLEVEEKVNSKLVVKCEKYNFTLKILTVEEQRAELEEKKRTEIYLNRKYKCELCGVGFVTKDVFEEHNKRHLESHSPHECPLCRLRFSTAPVLAQHRLAHARRFTCRLCGAVARRYSDCGTHRSKCGAPAPAVCGVCRKIFNNPNSLDNHIRGVHYSKEKKFVCTFCNQKFQTKQRLAIHTRTHTGQKPYQCDLCHRSFAANSNLRNHLSAHAHARPHYCVECDKSYKTRKGLRRHLLEGASHAARKTHSCHHCLKSFTSEKLLASHISTIHQKEPDSCGLCRKTFSSTANLKKHIQSVHEAPVV